jgi:FkbM family methyltransferase
MKSLKKIRLLLANYFGINIQFLKKNIYKNLETPDKENINIILNSNGILHIGAHRGSERFVYDHLGKPVVWIEANPYIFDELQLNLNEFKYQIAYNNLLYSKSNIEKDFFLSSNDGASSSINDFSEEFLEGKIEFNNLKRNIEMTDKIKMKTKTLDKIILDNNIEISKYDHWVIDVQGAELEVLKGSVENLDKCKSLTIEVSTHRFYKNSVLWNEIKDYLKSKNFYSVREPVKNHDDILFVKQ